MGIAYGKREKGHFITCRPDSRWDSYQPFRLTRKCDPPVDLDGLIKEVGDRLKTVEEDMKTVNSTDCLTRAQTARDACFTTHQAKYDQCMEKQAEEAKEFCSQFQKRLNECAQRMYSEAEKTCADKVYANYGVRSVDDCEHKFVDYTIKPAGPLDPAMAIKGNPCERGRDQECPPVATTCKDQLAKLNRLNWQRMIFEQDLSELRNLLSRSGRIRLCARDVQIPEGKMHEMSDK